MENQNSPELPVEVPPDEVATVDAPPVYQEKFPVFVPIIAVVFTVIVMGVIAIAVVNTGKKSPQNKTVSPQVIPTATKSAQSASTGTIPTAGTANSDKATLIDIPTAYLPLILEVAAIGGGAGGEKREYEVNLKPAAGDKLAVIKADEKVITSYPGYLQGATDYGLRVVHGKSHLDIVPVFEGAGFPLVKKVDSNVIKNNTIGSTMLRRLDASQMQSDVEMSITSGFVYTTQYREGKQNCSAFQSGTDTQYPACINGGLFVDVKGSDPVSITCAADKTDAAWCDAIVQSISFKNNPVVNSTGKTPSQ